ncbi:MAG: peptidoglycan DD-metalloendopeptidase family protein [Cyanobacteria bacterium J06639_14]
MVERGSSTGNTTPPAGGENSELAILKQELSAVRKELRSLNKKKSEKDELTKAREQLERARKKLENTKNPPPKPEPTVEEVLREELRKYNRELRSLVRSPERSQLALEQRLAKVQRELELARHNANSPLVKGAQGLSTDVAKLARALQKMQDEFDKKTGLATIKAIASELDAAKRELKSISGTLALSRLQLGLIFIGVCGVLIAIAEGVHYGRMAMNGLKQLPGMGMIFGEDGASGGSAGDSFAPSTSTPLSKGDAVAGYLVTSGFGSRIPPCDGCSSFHAGVDFATPTGTAVYAPYAATAQCREGFNNGAGDYLTVKPQSGEFPDFLLLHLDGCSSGEFNAGDRIGTTGASGRGTGPHLDLRQVEAGEKVIPTREWAERILTGDVPVAEEVATGLVMDGERVMADPAGAKAIVNIAGHLGLDPIELTALMSWESSGTLNPNKMGGDGDVYKGLIQFSPSNQQQYGISGQQTIAGQAPKIMQYLLDNGFRPSEHDIRHAYSAILAGEAPEKYWGRRDSNGTSVRNAFQRFQSGPHHERARQFLIKSGINL